MRYPFIDVEKANYPVVILCRVMHAPCAQEKPDGRIDRPKKGNEVLVAIIESISVRICVVTVFFTTTARTSAIASR